MGYYIQVPENTNKAKQLVEMYGAKILTPEEEDFYVGAGGFYLIPENEALFCVVSNGVFEAAGLIYSQSELDAFSDPMDTRPRQWVMFPDRETAWKLTNYKPRTATGQIMHG